MLCYVIFQLYYGVQTALKDPPIAVLNIDAQNAQYAYPIESMIAGSKSGGNRFVTNPRKNGTSHISNSVRVCITRAIIAFEEDCCIVLIFPQFDFCIIKNAPNDVEYATTAAKRKNEIKMRGSFDTAPSAGPIPINTPNGRIAIKMPNASINA